MIGFDRIHDARSRRVLFVSHCILDENVRYLGGAFREGCIAEIVNRCIERGIGIVQLPCPEQRAWGGVRKPLFLAAIGNRALRLESVRALAVPLFLRYTKRIYERLAREVARDIEDYVRSGIVVVGIVGIDGSPSCGVRTTIDVRRSLPMLAELDAARIDASDVNAIVRACVKDGSGLFADALRGALAKKGLEVPFLAHDLIGESRGERSSVLAE